MAARAYGRQSRRPADLYGYTTPGELIQEPWATTRWTEYYIPTVNGGRARRPVIYIAAPLPAGGLGGFGGGFGGIGGVSPYGPF